MEKGLVLNIQRMSTEDGPGLRTSVFMKGCPLACAWCHNPESISFKKEHEWFPEKCMMCKTCESVCETGALSFTDDKLTVGCGTCVKCMKCVKMCPTGALEAKGICYSTQELFDEIIKDKAYFGAEGGITLSGGEALAQTAFAAELLKKLKAEGVHTAVDTCGQVKFGILEEVYGDVSLFLYDLKVMDSGLHKEYTGLGNEMILDNLKKLAELIRGRGEADLWIRTPLIPGATDGEENVKALAEYIEKNIADVLGRWELLEFNNLGASKYERRGQDWEYKNVEKQTEEELDSIRKIISEFDKIPHKTYVAGREILSGG